MSLPNVEIAKRAIAAFNARDVEAFVALTAEDLQWSPSMSPIESQIFVGHDGAHRYFDALGEAWDRFEVMPERFREGSELVLMLGRLEGCGKVSGATVDSELGMAFDLRQGLIAGIRGFLDHDEALAATGVSD
jgi:ketosteroid isomerase-like protein